MNERLPRGVEWLLQFGVPADQREPIAGDLAEEYADRARRDGGIRSRIAIWFQAARLAWRFRWERTLHGRPLPPIGDEIRRAGMWDSIRQDVAFGARMLRRQPGFTTVAVIALALGIGANTAIFSIVDAVLWRPLPYPNGDQIVAIAEQRPREDRFLGPVSIPDFVDWRAQNRSFTAVAAHEPAPANLTGGGEPERVQTLWISPGFLTVLGIAPAQGRDFRAEEEKPGREHVVLLTHAFWVRRFGGESGIVGRAIPLNGIPFETIGVLPERFWWPSQPDILVPYAIGPDIGPMRASHSAGVVARRQPGVSLEQAGADMDGIGRTLSEQFPRENTGHAPNVVPFRRLLVGDVRDALLVLLGAVGLVLLIACANVATLLLARATSRHREIAIRVAIGAGRGRLIRQSLTESLLLGLAGGAAGLLLAEWSVRGLRAVLPVQFTALPGIDRVGVDLRVLAVALTVSVVTSIVFGLIPALATCHQRVGLALNEDGRGSGGSLRGRRARGALVIAEMALSLMLLAGAGLLIVSFKRLADVSPGFQAEHVVAAQLALPANRYGDHARVATFYQALVERMRSMPRVEAVGAVSHLPFSGQDARTGFRIEGRTAQSPIPVRAHPRLVTSEYLQTMRIPLKRGRLFTERDADGAVDVVIINDAAARRYWPNEDPVGRRLAFNVSLQPRWLEIVGIVGDVKHQRLDVEAEPEAYMPYLQRPFFSARGLSLVVRSTGDAAAVAPMVRAAVHELDQDLPVGVVAPLDDMIARSVAPQRLNFLLVSAFAFVALVLTAAGLYGVMAYLVAQRTREIGVRMALGATPRSVLALVLRQASAMTLIGIGLGLAGALALSRFLAALLFGVRAHDPMVYVSVSVVLTVVAFIAVVVPSRRATRIDPLRALRQP